MIFSDVSSVRAKAYDVFEARGTGSGWDTVEAGRHPPADGRTPETAAQRAVAAAEEPSLELLHCWGIAGKPKVDDEWINVLSESCVQAFKTNINADLRLKKKKTSTGCNFTMYQQGEDITMSTLCTAYQPTQIMGVSHAIKFIFKE